MPPTEHCLIRRHGLTAAVTCPGPLGRRVLKATVPATGRTPDAGRPDTWRVFTHRLNTLCDALHAAGVKVIDENLLGRAG